MRVLQFGKFYPPHIGGIERVMCDITEGLGRGGVHCDVLCSNKDRRYVEEVGAAGNRIMRTSSFGIVLSASISPQIIGKLRSIQDAYDIIHVHLPDPMAGLALFLARPRAKIVLHWHNDIVRQRFLLNFYLPIQAWLLRRADAVVTTSPNYIDGSPYLADHKAKCHVVPIGVDKNRLKVSAQKASEIRSRFPGKRIIFSIGRLSHYKGYTYLIDAARHLGDDYVILIAGLGPLEGDLERQIRKGRLEDRVALLGPVRYEDVGSYYEACDVYCLSSISRNEGFGLVQVEAMLFRKPVVSTSIEGSGVTWANLDGETGYVVEPCNPKALADAIIRICSDDDLAARLGENGFRRATTLFTVERMLASTLEVYSIVLGGLNVPRGAVT
jgi:glycosyltransferase involved in cell wall biosynthesis